MKKIDRDADQLFNQLVTGSNDGGMQEFGRYLLASFGGPKGLSEAVVDCYHGAPATARTQLLVNVMRFLQGLDMGDDESNADPDDLRAQAKKLLEDLDAQ